MSLHLIDGADEKEDDEGDDHEVYNGLDEQPIVERRSAGFLRRFKCSVRSTIQRYEQTGEVQSTQQQPHQRHNDIGHQRRYDLSKRSADNHTDCQGDNSTFDCDFSEFL